MTLGCLFAMLCAEESAIKHADGFTAAADALVAAIEKLYAGIEMPRSDFSVKALWS